MNESIYIILNQFKREHITDEEAVKLIEDIYKSKYICTPTFPSWVYEATTTFQNNCKQ
jgi:hypothetical protein